jgi:hypothetical protein
MTCSPAPALLRAPLCADPQLRADTGARAKERFLKGFERGLSYENRTRCYSGLIRS